MMRSGNFTDEFKRDAVAQITERRYPVAEVTARGLLGSNIKGVGGNEAAVMIDSLSGCNLSSFRGMGKSIYRWIA